MKIVKYDFDLNPLYSSKNPKRWVVRRHVMHEVLGGDVEFVLEYGSKESAKRAAIRLNHELNNDAERDANARLIAEAPELLRILRELHSAVHGYRFSVNRSGDGTAYSKQSDILSECMWEAEKIIREFTEG